MTAFDTLNEKVRRWIWQQGWEGLRDVQERSIPILLAGNRDLVIMAATAGGKTEAAFLPIVSKLTSDPPTADDGFKAVYVSPMRALINDQFGRMESLCADLDVEVTKWHGDVSESVKARARKNPSGIVLITPESLEALLVRRGKERLFRGLRYVVIDEMHVFLDDPRGKRKRSADPTPLVMPTRS
jgi:ATP-dependent Lhr-like helicase